MTQDITTELTFNQWQAYLLLIDNRIKTFNLYCKSCNFTDNERKMVINVFNDNK